MVVWGWEGVLVRVKAREEDEDEEDEEDEEVEEKDREEKDEEKQVEEKRMKEGTRFRAFVDLRVCNAVLQCFPRDNLKFI